MLLKFKAPLYCIALLTHEILDLFENVFNAKNLQISTPRFMHITDFVRTNSSAVRRSGQRNLQNAFSGDQYMPSMPPMPPGAGGAGGSGLSATSASVVRTMPLTLAAFSSALRATFVGSTMPLAIMSQYSSL